MTWDSPPEPREKWYPICPLCGADGMARDSWDGLWKCTCGGQIEEPREMDPHSEEWDDE